MGGVTEEDSPYTMLPTGTGYAARVIAANFRAWLASSASKPHRCAVRRKSRGRWAWECTETSCGGADWLGSQQIAFDSAFGHASGWVGPYPYQSSRMVTALERRPSY
jgi:hypothetical protein